MYTSQPGFFDISERPKTLDAKTHQKLQSVQMELMHMQSKAAYYRQHHPQQWEKAKEMSGQIQQIIFQHWSHEQLFE